MDKLPLGKLFGYSILGFPLAFIGLPLYLNAPKFYSETIGLSLSAIGGILLLVRILDGISDPIIGYLSDRFSSRHLAIILSSPLLAAGFYLLFNPPQIPQIAWWFALTTIITYLAYSIFVINLISLGAEITSDYNERTRISVTREGLGLLGVLLASILPQILVDSHGAKSGFHIYSIIFAIILILSIAIFRLAAPRSKVAATAEKSPNIFSEFLKILANRDFRSLIYIYIFNGIAAAIPATLVLFFIDDLLGTHNQTGYFLFTYFLSGALGMPLWNHLAKKFSKKTAWLISMLLSIVTFIGAFFLHHGDAFGFYIICFLSGLCLGADLSLPTAILSDIALPKGSTGTPRTACYFGLWNLVTKLNMALAAGITLPLLDKFGYHPGGQNSPRILIYLSATYALLPCMFKVIAAIRLYFSSIDKREPI